MTFSIRPLTAFAVGLLLVAGCGEGDLPPHAVDQPGPTATRLPITLGPADGSPVAQSTSEQAAELAGQQGTTQRGLWTAARRRTAIGEWTMQQTAIDALTRIGQPAVPALIEMLDDPKAQLRADAAIALARIGPDARGALPRLIALVQNDPDELVRKNAVRALGQIGPAAAPAIPALVEQLRAAADASAESGHPARLDPDEGSTGSAPPADGR